MARDILVMKFDAAKAARQLNIVVNKELALFKAAVRNTMIQAGAEVWRRVDKDIGRAGNFSARWPANYIVQNTFQGFNATMRTGFSRNIPYGHVHEFGATIRGKPLLWIPLPWNPFKERASKYPGQLFRVNRPGKNPLLFAKEDREAKYVGVQQVTLRPRFHIRTIVANVVRTQLAKLFAKYVKGTTTNG